jgi:hypothetical protein
MCHSQVSLRLKGSHSREATILNDYWILTVWVLLLLTIQMHPECSQTRLLIALLSIILLFRSVCFNCDIKRQSKRYGSWKTYKAREIFTIKSIHIGLVKLKASLNIRLKGYRVKLPVLDSRFETGTQADLCGWGTNSVSFKCHWKPFTISNVYRLKEYWWKRFKGSISKYFHRHTVPNCKRKKFTSQIFAEVRLEDTSQGNGLEHFHFIEVTFYLLHFTFNVLLQEIQVNWKEFVIEVGFIYWKCFLKDGPLLVNIVQIGK